MEKATTILVVLPGASQMQLVPVADGLRVTCPTCRASQLFAGVLPGKVHHEAFLHEADCAFLAAMRRAERAPFN